MRFFDYIKATQAEMAHVNWPTKAQTISFTAAVIGVSLVLSIMLGISDFVFSRLLTLLFK
jgi:preprotein translocase SecE subunit